MILVSLAALALGCAPVEEACTAFCSLHCTRQVGCGLAPTGVALPDALAACQKGCMETPVAGTQCATAYYQASETSCDALRATPCGPYCEQMCARAAACPASAEEPAVDAAACAEGCHLSPAVCYLADDPARVCGELRLEARCYEERAAGGPGSVVGCGTESAGDVGSGCEDADDCLGSLGCQSLPSVDGDDVLEGTGTCQACSDDDDCFSPSGGSLCGRDGRCRDGCTEPGHCPADRPLCRGGECQPQGVCEEDADCDPTERCHVNRCAKRCRSDAECGIESACAADNCVLPIGTACSLDRGHCNGGTCTNVDASNRTVPNPYCTRSCILVEACPAGYVCLDYSCLRL